MKLYESSDKSVTSASSNKSVISRRDFLIFMGVVATSLMLPVQGCTNRNSTPSLESERIQEWLNALNNQDWKHWRELNESNVIWHPKIGGTIEGQDQVQLRLQQSPRNQAQVSTLRIFSQNDRVCAQYVVRDIETTEPSICSVFRLQNGLVTEWFEYGCQTDPKYLETTKTPIIDQSNEQVAENMQLINEWTSYVNARDWAEYRNLHSPRAKGYFVGFQEPVDHLDDFVGEFQRYFDPQPQTKLELVRAFGQGDWVCAQFKIELFSVCEIFEVRNGKILQNFDYVSQASL